MYIRDLREDTIMTIGDLKTGECFEKRYTIYMVCHPLSIKRAKELRDRDVIECVELHTGKLKEFYINTLIHKVWCCVNMYDISKEVIDDKTGEVIHEPEVNPLNLEPIFDECDWEI